MNKLQKYLLISIVPLSLTSCSSTQENSSSISSAPSSSVEDSISSSSEKPNIEVIQNDDFYWMFQEEEALKGEIDISASSALDTSLSLKIDDKDVKPLSKNLLDFKFYYTLRDCNSDNANRAADYYYLNGVKQGKIPSNGSKGIDISFDDINIGLNTISITIGGWFGNPEYSFDSINRGICEDMYIQNVSLVSSTQFVMKPTKMIYYKCIKNKTGYNTYDMAYADNTEYKIGDGYSGELAYDGHPNPKYDIPQKIDFCFNYEIPEAIRSFHINTNEYSDGVHKVTLLSNNEVVLQNSFIIDNKDPEITINLDELDYVSSHYTLTPNFKDQTSGIVTKSVLVDGQVIDTTQIALSDYSMGMHNISLYAKDKAGNETYMTRNFEVISTGNYIKVDGTSSDAIHFTIQNQNISKTSLDVYEAASLNVTSQQEMDEMISSTSTDFTPSQEFDVKVSDVSKEVYVQYDGETLDAEKIVLYALNPTTQTYEKVGSTTSAQSLTLKLSPSMYANSDKVIHLKAEPLYYGNGSNTLLWSSDTQYLPKVAFTDINYMYKDLMRYISNEYKSNNMAYLVHTGDIVDDNPTYDDAEDEWKIATAAFDILDKDEVPYGVVAGNHDVGTDLNALDYSLYSKYFGSFRYNQNEYFGGDLGNNESHYDLVTIGEYDFIFLYVAYGKAGIQETVEWANKVLKSYPNRNAIVATHAYLTETGALDPSTMSQECLDNIVIPNENVKFVFCGHTDGNAVNKRVLDSGRVVYELLNCYQFVEKETYTVSHLINGYKCNGEGYIRKMIFNGDTIDCTTFSPITNKTNPLGSGDSYKLTVSLKTPNRTLTTSSLKACQLGDNVSSVSEISNMYTGDLNKTSSSNYIVVASDVAGGYGFSIL